MEREISIQLQAGIVYVTGIVNGNNVTFTLSENDTWVATIPRAMPDIYTCEITATRSDGSVITLNTVLYHGLQLITDRTMSDVEYAKSLHEKGLSGMTATELEEWASGLKGWYDYRDMNRVGSAMVYVKAKLKPAVGNINIEPKTDWTILDFPTYGAVEEYLNNLLKIRNSIVVTEDTPDVPSGILLNYEEANDIERILKIVDGLIDNIRQSYIYSNEIYCGEV